MLQKKNLKLILFLLTAACLLSGCCLSHSWAPANCTEPMTCTRCGRTEGRALGHIWEYATCTEAKYCPICGVSEGEPLGHDWVEASCDTAETCSRCGEIRGEALGHDWEDATCELPKTCIVCGKTEGEPLGHDWVEATQDEPRTCTICGLTEGEALGYTWADFPELPEKFWHSSGAGGWSTELTIDMDGSFKGEYSDSEMGETDDKYPHGTVYYSEFQGRFSIPVKMDAYTYSFTMEHLKTEDRTGKERIEEEIRYVASEPAGFEDANLFYLYLPGTPVENLPDEFLTWAHLDKDFEELPADCYGIYNVEGHAGFVGSDQEETWPGLSSDDPAEESGNETENWNLSDQEILEAVVRYMEEEKKITVDGVRYRAEIQEESEDGYSWVAIIYSKSGKTVDWIGVNRKSAQCVDATYQTIDMIFYLEP